MPALLNACNDAIKTALFIAHQDGSHWVAGRLILATGQCEIYDSLQGMGDSVPVTLQQSLRQSFTRLLPEKYHRQWSFSALPCPQQPNLDDCGVYTLATIWHLVTARDLPDSYTGTHWRAAIAGIIAARALRPYLTPELTDSLHNPPPLVAPSQNVAGDAVDSILQRAKLELSHLGEFWRGRKVLAQVAAGCLQREIEPLFLAWSSMASSSKLTGAIESRIVVAQEQEQMYELWQRQLTKPNVDLVPSSTAKIAMEVERCLQVARQLRRYMQNQESIIRNGTQRMISLGIEDVILELKARAMDCHELEQKALTANLGNVGPTNRHARASSWSGPPDTDSKIE